MLSADDVDGSAGGMILDLFDPMDFPENLSISIDNIYAILDEKQAPIANLMGASDDFYQGELAPCQVDNAETFDSKAVWEESRGEQTRWNLESSGCKTEMDCDFLFDSKGDFNNLSDNGSFLTSEWIDSKNFYPLPSQHSSDWLTLSCANSNDQMGGFGDPSESLLNSNVDHQLPNNIPEYGIPSGNAKAVEMQSNATNGVYLTSENENKRDCEQLQGDIYFQPEKKCKSDIEKLSSLCNLQTGSTGTSHYMSTEISSLCGGLNNSNTSALPVSKVEVGMYPLQPMYSHMNRDEILTDEVHEGNTLPRNSPTDVKLGFDQTKPPSFNPFLSCGYEKSDRKGYQLLSQNYYKTSEVKFEAKAGSPDCSLPEVSITDLETSLPDELGIGQSYSEESSLISESSTDSSPISSSQNFDFGHVDGCAADASERLSFDPEIILRAKNPKTVTNSERGEQFIVSCHNQHNVHKGGSAVVRKNPLVINLSMGDDSDVCILDDISDPAFPVGLPIRRKPQTISHCSGYNDSHYTGTGGHKLDDERLSFQRALQDLPQPISEASPPDGVLAVPLLRHQRIALSWMVHKETASIRCTGGILADDQGLGKTISTIALILMERSPSSKSCLVVEKQDDFESLNLDDDDCNHDVVSVMKQSQNSNPCVLSRPDMKENSVRVVKGRPQAGTLVVCPTSVLRQWAEELQTKVTSKANLSFLVYHGSNRTRDPNEVAKYDVVLTTYAIVSMEVPKQPLVDKSDEERGKQDLSSDGFINSKKKKTFNPQNRKASGTMDNTLLDSSARPLARVGWFRVVLDEAQSIKNHRTQVARACWGLRAKRRWCLSGTPIQNAIDDLYSYFRFLRFEPLEKYQSFCSTIKIPVNKDPANGYKKLQTVLKMIMLRRTKGTLLDGKPIINLPPKVVSLKKVEFSDEERAFYATLEAESQEQFKEYADAGTVKQNYVNILLMLLRLRQACDHRLLVKGINSISSQNSSLEMMKKLPSDKKRTLIRCLEASLAICAICHDAPEDSVVTICGHVFCNQCICEHLTGDETICPSSNCKIQLTVASVFSRSTLKSSLSDQLGHDCCSDSPGFEMKDTPRMCEDSSSSSYSSKIKAALNILQSLPKYKGFLKSNSEKSNGRFMGSVMNSSNTDSGRSSVDPSDIEHIDLDRCSDTKVSEKAIVFSQWTGMLDLLEPPLKASSIQYRRLDGTMSVAARERAIKDFNTLPEVTVMIMSLKAASLGLNMVAACHVLLLDLWWNPTTEDQAIDRAHRIGQTRPVTVSRLTIENTVEDRILNLQERKREVVANAFGEDDSGTRQTRLTEEDLRYLFMV